MYIWLPIAEIQHYLTKLLPVLSGFRSEDGQRKWNEENIFGLM
jgi:hypothetical protein